MINGVDTSWPQGAYRPGNESFVFVGASSADGGGLFVQSTYQRQVDNARAAGKEVGHYFFNGAVNPVTAADFFVNNLHDYRAGDGIALDVESSSGGTFPAWSWGSAEQWVDRVAARLGIPTHTIGIYCNRSDNGRPGGEGLVSRGCWLWIAWPGSESYITTGAWSDWAMWQHGITGIDRDVSKYSLAQLSSGTHTTGGDATPIGDDMSAAAEQQIANIYAGLFQGASVLIDGKVQKFNYGVLPIVAHNQTLIAGLSSAIQALATAKGLDPEALTASVVAAAEQGAVTALKTLTITVAPK